MLEGLTPPNNKSVYCKIDQLMQTLEPNDQEIFSHALADTTAWKARSLSQALRSRGVSVADTTITKHRQRVCACYRK